MDARHPHNPGCFSRAQICARAARVGAVLAVAGLVAASVGACRGTAPGQGSSGNSDVTVGDVNNAVSDAGTGNNAGDTGAPATALTGAPSGPNPGDPNATCVSKQMWNAGRGYSMRPGEDCNHCHRGRFSVNGTVYHEYHEENDCFGVPGVTVVLTDAKGKVHILKTDADGNFSANYWDMPIAMPFHAKIIYKGKERDMILPRSNGDCITCHTQHGQNLAPGRIVIPW